MIRLLAAITEGTHNIQEEPPLPDDGLPEESTVKPTVVTDDGEPCSLTCSVRVSFCLCLRISTLRLVYEFIATHTIAIYRKAGGFSV